jgi:hypothetical protein
LSAQGIDLITPTSVEHWTWPFLGPTPPEGTIAALVGFHSRADQPTGFRPHTVNDSVETITIDERSVGEVALLMMGLAGLEVVVGVVSGDRNATEEASQLDSATETVSVRWRGANGSTSFMSSEEAGRALRAAARRAAQRKRLPVATADSMKVTITMRSRKAVSGEGPKLAERWKGLIAKRKLPRRLLAGFAFPRWESIESKTLRWQAPNPLVAFLSAALAASTLRGTDNWDAVSRGYQAYSQGRYPEAIEAYEQALSQNGYDQATRCRLGAVFLKTEQPERALELFAQGAAHQSEMEPALQSWCTLGLAQAHEALGHGEAARKAAARVLELPDVAGRHEKAKAILAR